METTSEIVDSASHDCPLATQTYGTAAAKGAYVPSSPTRLGKGQDANLEGNRPGFFCTALSLELLSPMKPWDRASFQGL